MRIIHTGFTRRSFRLKQLTGTCFEYCGGVYFPIYSLASLAGMTWEELAGTLEDDDITILGETACLSAYFWYRLLSPKIEWDELMEAVRDGLR